MNKLNLTCVKFTRKSRKYSSYKGTVGKVADNRINRRFDTHIPYQKITTDTTEFKYYTKDSSGKTVIEKAYLDPFLDMFNGEILSYRLSMKPNAKAILDALEIGRASCRERVDVWRVVEEENEEVKEG